MNKGKIIKILCSTAGLALLFVGLGRAYLLRFHPTTQGRLELAGIDRPITILRDRTGIPHIRAGSARDALFGLGFVHAQDRMFQMDLLRRSAYGRLAEIAGVRALDHDRWLRILDLRGTARRAVARIDPDLRRELRAYSAGVNAYRRQQWGRWGLEFDLQGTIPEPWMPVDSAAIALLQAWGLSTNLQQERLALFLRGRLEPETIAALFPAYPGAPRAQAVDLPPVDPGAARLLRPTRRLQALLGSAGSEGGIAASNNWVVSASRSRSGRPLLANDPHLFLAFPSIWYLVDLRGGDLQVAGATMPGAAYVIIGNTPTLAWGMTNLMADNTDLVLLDRRPAGGRRERIEVRGAGAVVLEVPQSADGPVLPAEETGGRPIALAWSAHRWPDVVAGFARLNRARTVTQARDAARRFEAVALNLVLADRNGASGYQAAGAVPRRRTEPGPFPRCHHDRARAWFGRLAASELPAWEQPPEGFIATANHRIPGPIPELSAAWAAPYRLARIHQRLARPGSFDLDDLRRLQLDVDSLQWRMFRPTVELAAPEDSLAASLRALLLGWDGRIEAGSRGALAFHVLRAALIEELLHDELGPLFEDYLESQLFFYQVVDQALDRYDHPLWDDRTTVSSREHRETIVLRALEHAAVELISLGGSSVYGDLHRLELRHPLGRPPLLGALLNGPRRATPGDVNTINNGGFDDAAPYRQVLGSSLRYLVDLAETQRPRLVYPGGQSAHLLHRHRQDLVELWLTGGTVEVPTADAEIRAQLEAELLLLPTAR